MEGDMHLLLIGVNHRTAGLDLREALAFTRDECVQLLAAVVSAGAAEALVVSTCNRTEFYVVDATAGSADRRVRDAIVSLRGADMLAPAPSRYTAVDQDAARHLCRVAAGLDSMVLGDRQILGQVKEAAALARATSGVGPLLDRLLDCALRAGKRARAETGLSGGAVSVAAAAVRLAKSRVGGLAGQRVLVVGAGDTGRLLARQLASHTLADLAIANRTVATAQQLAQAAGGRALALAGIPEALETADVVISATSAPGHVITAATLSTAVARRRGAPLVVVDLAVPRDVEPAAGSIGGVTLVTLDAVNDAVDQTLSKRQAEIPRVEALVEAELARFESWRRSRAVTPVVRELRAYFEEVRADELSRLKHVGAEERARAERLTQALVNRLLHVPTVSLKDTDPASEAGRSRLHAARDLFALGRQRARRGAPHGH
jgi:glutamyl-tRNA reductase